ncbi:hypothetical protein K438DRAFT_1781399 [Mycena galopus ATCC 62051]|nr:hypothetical protein K438DRAFT_1781399 [Mycena galopus ATCC 62051]
MDLERWKVDFSNVAKMMSMPMCRKYLPNSELTFEAERRGRVEDAGRGVDGSESERVTATPHVHIRVHPTLPVLPEPTSTSGTGGVGDQVGRKGGTWVGLARPQGSSNQYAVEGSSDGRAAGVAGVGGSRFEIM